MTTHSSASLFVEMGVPDKARILLDRPVTVFGKSASVDVNIDHAYVSRRHFQLRCQDGVYFISDLDSTNGTYLNGERLNPNEERRVRDQDAIALAGDQVVLHFSDPVKTTRIDPLPDIPSSQSVELVLDSGAREARLRGTGLTPPLPRKEFDILELLYRNKGNAVTREQIAAAGWPERPNDVTDEEIDQYIRRLRRRIEEDPSHPKLVVTLRGFGYRMP